MSDSKKLLVGGQAVLEGVMMRVKNSVFVSVRNPQGEIMSKQLPLPPPAPKNSFKRRPVIRGMVALGQSLVLGVKALNFSANTALEDEDEKGPEEIGAFTMAMTVAFSFGMGMVLFVFLPLFLTNLLKDYLNLTSALAYNSVDGLFRATILVTYIWGISLIPNIRRVFEYHGAEHKVVYTYEDGKELTVENARPYSTLHPRCGTSFLLLVVLESIIIFTLIGRDITLLQKAVSRVFIMPLIAGLSYESLKLSAKHQGSALVRAIVKPGLMLQKITTIEPDDEQLEVAIHALKTALEDSGSNQSD